MLVTGLARESWPVVLRLRMDWPPATTAEPEPASAANHTTLPGSKRNHIARRKELEEDALESGRARKPKAKSPEGLVT